MTRYVWDTASNDTPVLLEARGAGGELLRRYEFNGENYTGFVDSSGTYHQIFSDVTGTVRGYGASTNQQAVEYDAFGNLVLGASLDIGFAGGIFDPVTRLTYFSSRWYDSGTGRFTQTDSASGSPQDSRTVNRYTYAFNDPINRIDPLGQDSFSLVETLNTLAVAGGLLSFGLGLYVASDPVSIMKRLSGGRLNFKNVTGSSSQFFELNINLFGKGESKAGFLRAGGKARGFTGEAQAGLTLDIGFELLNLKGDAQSQLFFYIGLGLGGSVGVSAGASLGGKGSPVGATLAPIRQAIVFDTESFGNYEGHFISIHGGASLRLTFPNPISPTGRGGLKFSRGAGVAFSPVGYQGGAGTLYSHTITYPFVSTPLVNAKGWGVSFSLSGGIGYSYYIPLFDPFVPPRIF